MVVLAMKSDIVTNSIYFHSRSDMAIHNEYGLSSRVVENQILAPT